MTKDTGKVLIHGKEYRTVALRVSEFREQYPKWAIVTEVVEADKDRVVMKAMILDDTGRIIGTGHAEENRASSQINRTSALENCETSAIGRALAACGYAGTEYASANEVENAIHQQERNKVHIPVKQKREFVSQVIAALETGNEIDLQALWDEWDSDEKVVLWKEFNSQQRATMKELLNA